MKGGIKFSSGVQFVGTSIVAFICGPDCCLSCSRPVNVVCWRRAICLEFMEKADVLEYYDQTVNSPSGSFYIPAVLRVPHLLQVVQRRRIKNTLSRKNILYRDNYTCQYCSARENLTIDHVLPIARGGEWKWENLVC
ncbi:hypothetical protein Pint_20185 [Pistacia integerrima]|uniref:Uncharacterized protein n=1 Tax=Pistacia integerrima TaxID=434235 RepID=A0ACC0XCJ2_9ROSI|nr:hypothetical protein Pint_20185 [Pistacia integerrima]